jgi:hypothetical protein
MLICFQIADEKTPTASQGASEHPRWHLKPRYWLEVRPHEYPKLSESIKARLISYARNACDSLNIPKSDPIWEHFRAPPSSNPSSSHIKTSQSVPASGIKASPQSSGDASRDKQVRSARLDDSNTRAPVITHKKPKINTTVQRVKPITEVDSKRTSGKDEERAFKSQRPAESARPSGMNARDSMTLPGKRKQASRDDNEEEPRRSLPKPVPKKRKIDESSSSTSGMDGKKIERERPNAKSEATVTKREPSPSPTPPVASRMPKFQKSLKGSAEISLGHRQRKWDYTSSEDEGELPQEISVSRTLEDMIPLANESVSSTSSNDIPALRGRVSPANRSREVLRRRYKTLYQEYITTFQRVCVQRGLIEQRLERWERGSATGSDVDGDANMLDAEALNKLSADLRQYTSELEEIRREYDDSP